MIEVNVQGAFISLDEEEQFLIGKYGLVFNRRENYKEGWIIGKSFSIEELTLWQTMKDFAFAGFSADVYGESITFEIK